MQQQELSFMSQIYNKLQVGFIFKHVPSSPTLGYFISVLDTENKEDNTSADIRYSVTATEVNPKHIFIESCKPSSEIIEA